MALCALHSQLTKLVWHVLVEVMDKPASADFYGLSCTVYPVQYTTQQTKRLTQIYSQKYQTSSNFNGDKQLNPVNR